MVVLLVWACLFSLFVMQRYDKKPRLSPFFRIFKLDQGTGSGDGSLIQLAERIKEPSPDPVMAENMEYSEIICIFAGGYY